MNDIRPTSGRSGVSVRWMTRLLSIVISSVFLLIIGLAVTNEDKPQGAAIPVLALLVLTIVASLAAWRWEKVGGLVVVLLALCLSVAAHSASLAFGLGSLSFLPALLYGAPFLVVGILFWVCGQITASGSHHDFAPPPPVLPALVAGAILVIIVALMTGARPGGWLDVALNVSGCLGVLEQHDGSVQSVAFSPDGALLASGSQDGTARVWRVADRTLLHALKISTGGRDAGYSHDVAFSPDGTTLAFGLPDGTVRLWRLSGDKQHPQATLLHTLRVDAGKICSLGFSPDGRTLVAGAWNGSVHLWRVTDGTPVRSLKGHTAGVISVAFSPDGMTLASASLDGTTKLWDISSATLIHELEEPSITTGVAFSPDGSMLATDRQLWSADDWSSIRELESTRGGMGNVVFSPDGTMLAAGNAWYEVRWWRVADGALLRAVRGHRDSVNSVAFSPDGKTLASGSLDGTVKLWRVP
jgi:sugar lactone lactonase YvrE